jgi:hypothetical protein
VIPAIDNILVGFAVLSVMGGALVAFLLRLSRGSRYQPLFQGYEAETRPAADDHAASVRPQHTVLHTN